MCADDVHDEGVDRPVPAIRGWDVSGDRLGREDVLRHRRRLTLETRTLTTTLQSALTDLELSNDTSAEERVRLRREWCLGVRLLLHKVRARSMRLDLLLRNYESAGVDAPGPLGTGYLDEADALVMAMENA